LPQATRDTLRGQYKAAGYSDDALTAAGYGQGSPAAPVIAGEKNVTPPGAAASVTVPNDGLSHKQRVAGYKHALIHVADKEAVIAAAERDGITRAELAYEAPSEREVAQTKRDAEVAGALAAPEKAVDYQLTYDRSFIEDMPVEDLQAFDVETRQAFHAAGVPQSMAQGLLETIVDTGGIYYEMSDAAKQLRFAEEGALFKRLSQNPEEDARLAAIGYSAFPAEYREILDSNLALHSARAQLALAGIGRAIEYRQSRKK
jgi:hypothetical protein